MAFTGKATYSAGSGLPEIAEDVADLIGIVSPYETPFLDALGDPLRAATSTYHEWLEDSLLANKDSIDDASISSPSSETAFDVASGGVFRVGDQIQVEGSQELMLVTDVSGNTLTVVRGYAGTTPENLVDQQVVNILGNAALEGADRPAVRFTNRTRCSNYTQIFTAAVEVSSPEGSSSVRRTMKGVMAHLSTNAYATGDSGFPAGTDLDEEKINYVLRRIWEESSSNIDLIVVGGFQKRKINGFLSASRAYEAADTTYRDMVSVYESDFGVCRIVTTRWMPQDAALMLDSSRVNVLPLAGRSFHFKPLASSGDYECGELIGEYTLELKNESAHGLIRGLSTS